MNEYEVEIITHNHVAGGTYKATSKTEAVQQAVDSNGFCYKEDVKYMNATNWESEEADLLESDDIRPLLREYDTEVTTLDSVYYDTETAYSIREAERIAKSKIPYSEASNIVRINAEEIGFVVFGK